MITFKPGQRIKSAAMNANFAEVSRTAERAKETATNAETAVEQNRRVINQHQDALNSAGQRLNALEARPTPTLNAEVIENLTIGNGWSDTYSPMGIRLERIGPLRRLIITARISSFTPQTAGGTIVTLPEGSRPTPSRRSYRLLGMGLVEYSGPSEYVPVPLVVTSLGNVQIAPGHVPARKFIQLTAEIIFKPEQ